MRNTPNDCTDAELEALREGRPIPTKREVASAAASSLEQRLLHPKRAPATRSGHALHFDTTIPLPWLLEELQKLGLRASNRLDGGLYVGMTPELRAKFAAAVDTDAERARRASVDAGYER
jgi:hypothetical protein